jgi:opacity protein-like surface antigen
MAEETDGYAPAYLGASGGIFLPGNGNSLKRAAMASARGGWYVSDNLAIELEGGSVPNAVSSHGGNATVTSLAARGLFHLTGIDEFDKLFGCERFDPFVTFGASALFASRHVFADDSHRTAIGPTVGAGVFYHLSDSWSLRFDATAAMALDTPCGMAYGLSAGLQWTFGE